MQRSDPDLSIGEWHRPDDPENLAEGYESTLDKIACGPRVGLDYKVLAGYDDIRTVRINDKERMLLTKIEKNGRSRLTVCGIMLDHKHATHPMMQPGVLEHFRRLHGHRVQLDAAHQEIPEDRFVAVDAETCTWLPPLMPRPADGKIRKKRVYFDKTKFIVLNAEQASVAEAMDPREEFRFILLGEAGSGKSSVISAVMENYAAGYLADDETLGEKVQESALSILCVAKSKHVVDFLQRNWELSPLAARYQKKQVVFRDYASLVYELDPAAKTRNVVGEKEFGNFFNDVITKKLTADRVTGKKVLSFDLLSRQQFVYNELRIISGCHTWERYQELGKAQSLFRKDEDMEWLFEVYKLYQAYLNSKEVNGIDFSFYRLDVDKKYPRIVIDEAADLSECALDNLFRLTPNEEVCVALSNNQSLHDYHLKVDYAKWRLGAKDGRVKVVVLKESYRCGATIADVAKETVKMYEQLTGRRLDEAKAGNGADHADRVEILHELTKHKIAAIKAAADGDTFVVLTRKEFVKEAQRDFPGAKVETVETAKGLEYAVVLLYRIMECPVLFDANTALDKKEVDIKYVIELNTLYTACTRAIKHLIIYEQAKHKLRFVLKRLQGALPAQAVVVVDTKDELFRRFKELVVADRIEEARKLGARAELAMSAEEINQIIADLAPAREVVATVVKEPTPKFFKPAKTPDANSVQLSKEELESFIKSEKVDLTILASIFGKRNTLHVLFNIPLLKEGECLFALLFEREASREAMLTVYLPKYFDQLAPSMTCAALSRKQPAEVKADNLVPVRVVTDINKMPPIYWMVRQLEVFLLLAKKKEFGRLWDVKLLPGITTTFLDTSSSQNGHNALYFLTGYQDGMVPLRKLVKSGFKLRALPPAMFFCGLFAAEGNSTQTSIFSNLLLHVETCGELLFETMQNNKAYLNHVTLKDMFPLTQTSKPTPSLLVVNVRKFPKGRAVIKLIGENAPNIETTPLHDFTDYELTRINRILKPAVDKLAAKTKFIWDVLNGYQTRLEKANAETDKKQSDQLRVDANQFLLANLLTLIVQRRESASDYFYHIPINYKDNTECLFFHLVYHEESRHVIYKLIQEYEEFFDGTIVPHALWGTDNMAGKLFSPWMHMFDSIMMRPYLLKWTGITQDRENKLENRPLDRPPLMVKMITLRQLFTPMRNPHYGQESRMTSAKLSAVTNICLRNQFEITPFMQLCLTEEGMMLIEKITAGKRKPDVYFDRELFMEEFLVYNNDDNCRMNMLQAFLHDTVRSPFILRWISLPYSADYVSIMEEIIDSCFIKVNGLQQTGLIHKISSETMHYGLIECLLRSLAGIGALTFFLIEASDEYKQKLCRIMLSPFTRDIPQHSIWMNAFASFLIATAKKSYVQPAHFIDALIRAYQEQPDDLLDLDPELFKAPIPEKVTEDEGFMAQIMFYIHAVPKGKELYRCLKARAEKLEKKAEPKFKR